MGLTELTGYGDEVIAYRLDGRSGALAVVVNLGALGVKLPGGRRCSSPPTPWSPAGFRTDTAACPGAGRGVLMARAADFVLHTPRWRWPIAVGRSTRPMSGWRTR